MGALDDVRELFAPAAGSIYLDAATYGLPPRPTVEVMQVALAAWQAGTADWITDWDRRGELARQAFAALVERPVDTIALVPSVSVGVATVAAGVGPDDEILLPDDEFNSVNYPLRVAAAEVGAQVRTSDFATLPAAIGPRTTLVAVSLVQSQSGQAAELPRLVQRAHEVGARVLVDATHAVPFVRLDAPVDFLVCAAYKHLLCPRGVAFLYCDPRHQTLPPRLANWRSARDPYGHYYGGELALAETAARYDVSLAWLPWVGAATSLELLVEWRRQRVLDAPPALARQLAASLGLPTPPATVLRVPVIDDAELVRDRLRERGVLAAVRAGSVRVSPHVYNTPAQMDAAAAVLGPFVRQSVPA
jgi:selenocysteine lyase/cysteine desulfurase